MLCSISKYEEEYFLMLFMICTKEK